MKRITPNFPEEFVQKGITKKNYLEGDGIPVGTFAELRQRIAELSCLHPDSVLFFRGQHTDHKREYGQDRRMISTFLPSIYRGKLTKGELMSRWRKLDYATRKLQEKLDLWSRATKKEYEFLIDKKYAQWGVLQHYEVVPTPFLDITQSLRVACSFAELGRKADNAYIYVFALPYPTGRISINSEHYLTNVRLLSVLPSSVRRPHFQEGFLVGEDDFIQDDKFRESVDVRCRAVAKFKINLAHDSKFWGNGVNRDRPLTEEELYPDITTPDELSKICKEIKEEIEYYQFDYGSKEGVEEFLSLWLRIERYLHGYQRELMGDRTPTVVKALKTMKFRGTKEENLGILELVSEIQNLKTSRNNLVHKGSLSVDLGNMIVDARILIKKMESLIPGIKNMSDYWEREKSKLE